MGNTLSVKQRIYPWLIVFCCCCVSITGTSLTVNAAGLFFQPVAQALDVGIGSVSVYLSIRNLACGCCGPFAIRLIRRVDPRLAIGVSTAAIAVTYLAFGSVTALWQLYLGGLIQGIASSVVGMVTVTALANQWFHRSVGLVTGIAFSSSGFASVLISPAVSALIDTFGWQTSYIILAVMVCAAALPAILLVRLSPAELRLKPYGWDGDTPSPVESAAPSSPQKSKLYTPSFFLLSAVALCGVSMTGFTSHLAGYAASLGAGTTLGALMTSAAMAGNTLSKLLIGVLCDVLRPKRAGLTAMAAIFCGFCGLALANGGHAVLLLSSAFLIGFAFSIGGVTISNMTKQFFGAEHVADAYAQVNVVMYFGSAATIPAIGWVYDKTGSYAPALFACAAGALFTMLLIHLLYRKLPH